MKTNTMRPSVAARAAVTALVVAGLVACGGRVARAQTLTVVRGAIERTALDGTRRPVADVEVSLQDSATARRWRPVYTGRDGLYYVDRVPTGTYYLDVRLPQAQVATRYKIRASTQAYTDIAPITVH